MVMKRIELDATIGRMDRLIAKAQDIEDGFNPQFLQHLAEDGVDDAYNESANATDEERHQLLLSMQNYVNDNKLDI